MNKPINLTELAYCLADGNSKPRPTVVRGIAPRFIRPGEPIEKSLERQQASFDAIQAKRKGAQS